MREVLLEDGQAGCCKASDLAVATPGDLGLGLGDRLAVSFYLKVCEQAIEVGAVEGGDRPKRPLLQRRGLGWDCDPQPLGQGRSFLKGGGVVGHQVLREIADIVCGRLGQCGLSAGDIEEIRLDVRLEPALV